MPNEKNIVPFTRSRTKLRPWAWARQQCVGDDRTKHVLITLAAYAPDEDGSAFPFVKTLARECEMSPSTIKRRLKKLVALGLIARVPQLRKNVHTANLYVLAPWIGSVQPCTDGSVQPCTDGSVQPCTDIGSPVSRRSVQSGTDNKNDPERQFNGAADVLARVRGRLGWKAYERVFDGCTARSGPPVEIVFPYRFRANAAQNEFGERLSDLLGVDWKASWKREDRGRDT